MSASTPVKAERKRHPIVHHATKPHGIMVIGVIVFLVAWVAWNMWIAEAIATN